MMWRDDQASYTLQRIITPLPRVSRVTMAPSQQELEIIVAHLRLSAEVQKKLGLPEGLYSAEDLKREEKEIKQNPVKFSFWMVDTPMTLEEIKQFYAQEENRKGWNLVAQDGNFLVLKRSGYTMEIKYDKTWYPDKRQVDYVLYW